MIPDMEQGELGLNFAVSVTVCVCDSISWWIEEGGMYVLGFLMFVCMVCVHVCVCMFVYMCMCTCVYSLKVHVRSPINHHLSF